MIHVHVVHQRHVEFVDDQLLEGLLSGQRYLHSIGIVGWQDALVGEGLGMPDTLATYTSAKRAGLLTAKVRLALWCDGSG